MHAFSKASERGRDPAGPEKAAEVVREFERRYQNVFTRTKLGRSKAYPRLLLMAYALGRDGRPFAFSEHRIAHCMGIAPSAVSNFCSLICRQGYAYVIREGISGVNGQPTWYRLVVPSVEYELGLDGLYWTFKDEVAALMR